jgi:hypothetical protein
VNALLVTFALGAMDAGVQEQDAGPVTLDAPVYARCREAPPLEPSDGGYFLPEARAQRLTCLLSTCELDRREKSKLLMELPPAPTWWLWVLSVTSAIALGALVARLWP